MYYLLDEHPLAHCQRRLSKLVLPYQQHTSCFSNPFIEILSRVQVCVQCWQTAALRATGAIDPILVLVCHMEVFAPRPILILGALVYREN
jgi:hypothetical protein